MLFQYTLFMFTVALVATIFSFHRNIEDMGQFIFKLVGGFMWLGFALSLMKVDFRWGGAVAAVTNTYIPAQEAWAMVYGFGIIGFILTTMGLLQAFELLYKPVGIFVKQLESGETNHRPWEL